MMSYGDPASWAWVLGGSRERGGRRTTDRSSSDHIAANMYTDNDFDVVDAVREVAAARDLPTRPDRPRLAPRQAGITAPILGATKTQHLDDAIAALPLHLTEDEITTLESPYRPHPRPRLSRSPVFAHAGATLCGRVVLRADPQLLRPPRQAPQPLVRERG